MRLRIQATLVAFAVLFLFTGVAAAENGLTAGIVELFVEFLQGIADLLSTEYLT